MTNAQQTVLTEVSGSEQPHEEVEFTELRPVEQSRIKDTQNDKEGTTDGFKVLRSIAEETRQDFESIQKIDEEEAIAEETSSKLKRQRRGKWKSLIEDDEGHEHDGDTVPTRKSQRTKCPKIISSESSWSEVSLSEWSERSDDEEEDNAKKKNKKFNSVNKKRKPKNKGVLKDEVYYYRQHMDEENLSNMKKNVFKNMADNFSNTNASLNPAKKLKTYSRKNKESDIGNSMNNVTDEGKNEPEDVRLKIGVVMESIYLQEQKNNNMDREENKQLENSSQSLNESTNSSESNSSQKPDNKISKDQTTCTRDDQLDVKKYCCLMCDAKFKGSGGLRNHWKVMHATGPLFKCDDCGKEFPLKERLKLHVRTHTGFKPYKCSECDKSFARGGQLAQHRRTHSHVKPYHCTLCTGTFTCAANLALHMKRHNGQKDHKCGICGREFIRRDALKKHLECLHKDVKSFLCIICKKTFKGHLPQHMRTHCQDRPHGCATCGQRFAQKSQLTVHQRTHSGQRPFRCLVCWQAFAHSTALKLHTRRHTGERPFKCNVCNAGFTQLPHWKKHMKCIHGRSKPYSCKSCNKFFKMKNDLEAHEKNCGTADENDGEDGEASESLKGTEAFKSMSVEKMRLLLAVLLKRISKPEKLDELGFGKRLIDEILQDSLVTAGKVPVEIGEFTELEALRKNLEMFLEWTVPKEHWEVFKKMNKTPEEILEILTAT